MLLRIPQALTSEELAKVRQLILSADWTDGRITAGSQSGTVKNNLQLPEELPKAQQASRPAGQAHRVRRAGTQPDVYHRGAAEIGLPAPV